METLVGTEIASTGVRRTQVYQATHKGEQTLPFMNRSFISFTYGDRKIEDFNLIATITNNRLNRTGSAPFEDTVSSYSNLDGQYYWGTHYKANQIDFVLATDGIDQKELDEFLYWFKAGTVRTLVLAEHPYREIPARVSEPPTLNLLPFQHQTTQVYAGTTYNVTTTIYKGEINLSLVMDEPHWYGKVNILGEEVEENGVKRYADIWKDPFTKQEDSIFASQDALKILYEDGIPLGSMIFTNMLLGNGAYANVEDDPETQIWSLGETEEEEDRDDFFTAGHGARIAGTVTDSPYQETMWTYKLFINDARNALGEEATDAEVRAKAKEMWLNHETFKNIGCLVANNEPGEEYVGRIFGAIVTVDGNGISFLDSKYSTNPYTPKYGYFFYSGTAPSPMTITFTMSPILDLITLENQLNTGYIISPLSKFKANGDNNKDNVFNTIFIQSVHLQELRLTIPNLFTSYNRAVEVFNTLIDGRSTWEYIRTAICNRVRHPAVRAWALKCIAYAQKLQEDAAVAAEREVESYAINPSTGKLSMYMQYFLLPPGGSEPYSATFTFDSKTGLAIGEFQYRQIESTLPSDWSTYGTNGGNIKIIKEDVGDMLRSNHIIIQDRNYPEEKTGTIIGWEEKDPEVNRKYTHRISHDIEGGISNIQIIYNNRYL